jgi:23S rRNA (cytidine1920-2'-O)/16S rRNA (cytidine1409-2'-O)-methyltransferase
MATGGNAVSMTKRRIDHLLVERGLAESQKKAQALIMAGEVQVTWRTAIKPGTLISEETPITVLEPPPFVSRGGIKLEYALKQFRLDMAGKVAIDIGASTGGFTDCLLKRGASRVYALDVGYGQLDYRLRQDHRVIVMDRVNARYPILLPEKAILATIDVSFISVEKVIPSVPDLLEENGYLLVLVKPQFEAKPKDVGKGGVIKNPQIHAKVLGRFIAWATEHRFSLGGLLASPISGASGTKEFLILLKR